MTRKKGCHDCGVKEGQIHKRGCDMERCPFCDGQLISCNCIYEKLNIDCKQEAQWLAILEKKGRVPYIIYPIICCRCAKLWPKLFIVPEEEWNKYIQISKRKNVICEPCFSEIKLLINNKP